MILSRSYLPRRLLHVGVLTHAAPLYAHGSRTLVGAWHVGSCNHAACLVLVPDPRVNARRFLHPRCVSRFEPAHLRGVRPCWASGLRLHLPPVLNFGLLLARRFLTHAAVGTLYLTLGFCSSVIPQGPVVAARPHSAPQRSCFALLGVFRRPHALHHEVRAFVLPRSRSQHPSGWHPVADTSLLASRVITLEPRPCPQVPVWASAHATH